MSGIERLDGEVDRLYERGAGFCDHHKQTRKSRITESGSRLANRLRNPR